MQIHGYNKTTLLDFPGHLAATVFTGGCNLRCPFCHNKDLVLYPDRQPMISEEEIFTHLKRRKGVLEGVCITGGEPTLQPDLEDFIRRVKAFGYLVKLDTNGYRPEILEHLIREGLVDYVAMDVKASYENYARATGCHDIDITRIEKSIHLLKRSSIPYEFRTTVVKGIHELDEFEQIGKMLQGCELYCLQVFRENENVIGDGCETYSCAEMNKILEITKKYIEKVIIRGVE